MAVPGILRRLLLLGACGLGAQSPAWLKPLPYVSQDFGLRQGRCFAGQDYVVQRGSDRVVLFDAEAAPKNLHVVKLPERTPGPHASPVFYNGAVWCSQERSIYRYHPETKQWIQEARSPISFRSFVPLYDGSFLLLGTSSWESLDKPPKPAALLARLVRDVPETLLDYPKSLGGHPEAFVQGLLDLKVTEVEESIVLYNPFTGWMASYDGAHHALHELSVPWKVLPFDQVSTVLEDPKRWSELVVGRRDGTVEKTRTLQNQGPWMVYLVPSQAQRATVLYWESWGSQKAASAEEIAHFNGPDSSGMKGFSLDLRSSQSYPLSLAEKVPGPWWVDATGQLLSLRPLLDKALDSH